MVTALIGYLWWLCLGLCCHFSSCFIDNLCDNQSHFTREERKGAKLLKLLRKFWSWAEIRAPHAKDWVPLPQRLQGKLKSFLFVWLWTSWSHSNFIETRVIIKLISLCVILLFPDPGMAGNWIFAYGYRCSQENVEWVGWDMPNASHFHLIELPFSQVFLRREIALARIFQGTKSGSLPIYSVWKSEDPGCSGGCIYLIFRSLSQLNSDPN